MRLPRVQFTLRSIMELVAVAALVLVVATNNDGPHNGITDMRVVIPVACVVAAVYGVGAVRRPLRFLLPLIAIWILTPQVDHPTPDVINLSAAGCFVAWVIGAISRFLAWAWAFPSDPVAAETQKPG